MRQVGGLPIGGLPNESSAMHFQKTRGKVSVVTHEVIVNGLIVNGLIWLQSQIRADDLHAQNLAIVQSRQGTALAQTRLGPSRNQLVYGIIHLAKARYNQIVQVHGVS
jgi:hypothetical protein